MRRDAFMKELEYLLQDIPDEDKADALAYYEDYLEEAGPENEEKVIQDFGSPERVAAIIRADIFGNLEDGGEFTDKGYEDERFREPNFQLVKHQEGIEEGENEQNPQTDTKSGYAAGSDPGYGTGNGYASGSGYGAGNGSGSGSGYGTGNGSGSGNGYGADNGSGSGNGYGAGNGSGSGSGYGTGNGYGSGNPGRAGTYGNAQSTTGSRVNDGRGVYMGKPAAGEQRGRWEWWQILGIILLGFCIIPVVLPLVFGISGGAIGLFFGLSGLLVAVFAVVSIGLAAVTLVLLIGGLLLIIVSFAQMSVDMVEAVLCLGTGVGIFGIGLLCLALCGLYYGIFLPWLVKLMIRVIHRLIHRKEVAV